MLPRKRMRGGLKSGPGDGAAGGGKPLAGMQHQQKANLGATAHGLGLRGVAAAPDGGAGRQRREGVRVDGRQVPERQSVYGLERRHAA